MLLRLMSHDIMTSLSLIIQYTSIYFHAILEENNRTCLEQRVYEKGLGYEPYRIPCGA